MAGLDDSADLVPEVVPVTAPGLADVDDHIELLRALAERGARLGDLHRDRMAPVGEADGRAGLHARPVE
jgi:hypothetical protein